LTGKIQYNSSEIKSYSYENENVQFRDFFWPSLMAKILKYNQLLKELRD
jgi:hypothetical protein